MNDKLRQAITAIKSGDKVTGQQLLAQVIKAEPKNETAWLWMTTVTDDPEKKRHCLKTVLQINPSNEMAQKGLATLKPPQSLKSVDIPETENIVSQPIPSQSIEESPLQPVEQIVPASTPSKSSISDNQPIKSKLVKPIQLASEPKKVPTSPKPVTTAPKAASKNRTIIYIFAIATVGIIVVCIGCFTFSLIFTSSPSFKATQTARAVAQATATPTSTFTPTPTSTPTPSFVLLLPQELRSNEGLVFSVNRVDFLTSIDDPAQRYAPQNGIFLWLVGTVNNSTNEYNCVHGDEFTLRNDEKKYQMSREIAEAIHNVYDLDYPGFFLGQCLDSNETTNSFLIFDAPKEAEDLWLELGNTKIQIGQLSTLMEVTPIPFIPPTPLPTNTPLPTDTPLPTNTPMPTSTLIPPDTPVEEWPDEYKALLIKEVLRSQGDVVVKEVKFDVVEGSRVVVITIETQGGTGEMTDETTLKEALAPFVVAYQSNQELKSGIETVIVQAQTCLSTNF